MSNRRMGGMGGFNRGNRSFSQQPFQGGVNPWQGGSNNMNQGGLLSQLTSNPQLALALTSLLQPQQQQPPSLLSLNTSPAFSHDRDFGRFGNRGRDLRRHEPYNKNRLGFRSGDNKNRNRGNLNRDRKRSPKRDDKKKIDKKPVGDKKNEKGKDKNDDAVDEMDDEKDEEGKESKRDWKDEKNQTEGKEESGDEGEGKKENKEGRYVGVPAKYLNCFVCNKQMWDGESMGKHVRGRAHQEMMKSLEESIHICVGILRENMRLTEERKMIEWNRQNRLKKYGKKHNEPESHCNMCDLKFLGKLVSHRRTDGHQRLKRYLHPNCRICSKEFPSRLEYIEHRLTPEHLRRLHESTENKVGGKDGMEVTEGDGEDLNLEPLLGESLEMESESPILELEDNLEGLQNQMPAYKKERPVSTKSLKPFTGFLCDLCYRSFEDEQDAQDHLKTRRHFYKFVEAVKERFAMKERREKREKEDAERNRNESEEKGDESKNEDDEVNEEADAEGEVEADANGDQEMYDPEEVTNNENDEGEGAEEEETDGDNSTLQMDHSQIEEDSVQEEEPLGEVKKEEEPEEEEQEEIVQEKVEIKKEVIKKEPPPTPQQKPGPASTKKTNVKNGAGPRSKKLSTTVNEEAAKPSMETYHIPKKPPAKSLRGKAQRGK